MLNRNTPTPPPSVVPRGTKMIKYIFKTIYTRPPKKFPFVFCNKISIPYTLSHRFTELIPFLYQGIYVGNTIYYMLVYIYILVIILSSIYYKERIKNKKESVVGTRLLYKTPHPYRCINKNNPYYRGYLIFVGSIHPFVS